MAVVITPLVVGIHIRTWTVEADAADVAAVIPHGFINADGVAQIPHSVQISSRDANSVGGQPYVGLVDNANINLGFLGPNAKVYTVRADWLHTIHR